MVPTIHQAGTNIRSEEHLESLTLTIFRSNLFKNQWQQASVQGQTKKNHNEEKENVTSHFSYCSRIREPNDAVDIIYS